MSTSHFFAFGLNHTTASVSSREAFAFDAARRKRFYEQAGRRAACLLLTTCNRTEVYGWGSPADGRYLQTILEEVAGATWPAEHAFTYRGEEALRHAIEVTCGLRSQALGDEQIFSQVKRAYAEADRAGVLETMTHRWMHTAFRAAKRVRTETPLGSGASSTAYRALDAVRLHFDTTDLQDRSALVLGLGQMGQALLPLLERSGFGKVTVSNRTSARSGAMARRFAVETVRWMDRHSAAQRHDVVFVATGAPEPVLLAESLEAPSRDLLLLDLAMPRNVEQETGHLANVNLMDLDHLRALPRDEAGLRAALPQARAICREMQEELSSWYRHRQTEGSALSSMHDAFESIRLREMDRHADRVGAEEPEELDDLTRSLVEKMVGTAAARMRHLSPVEARQAAALLEQLFGPSRSLREVRGNAA